MALSFRFFEATSRVPKPCARSRRGGQTFLEYALLFVVITAALLGMQIFAKRGLQAGLKMTADRLSPYNQGAGGADPHGEFAQMDGMLREAVKPSERFQDGQDVDGSWVVVQDSRTRTTAAQRINIERGQDGSVRTTVVEDTSVTEADLGQGNLSKQTVVATDAETICLGCPD